MSICACGNEDGGIEEEEEQEEEAVDVDEEEEEEDDDMASTTAALFVCDVEEVDDNIQEEASCQFLWSEFVRQECKAKEYQFHNQLIHKNRSLTTSTSTSSTSTSSNNNPTTAPSVLQKVVVGIDGSISSKPLRFVLVEATSHG